MSVIGPDLPPHLLAKRKRQQEAESQDAAERDRQDGIQEKRRRGSASNVKRADAQDVAEAVPSSIGPMRPPKEGLQSVSSIERPSIGPAMPPGPLDERPVDHPNPRSDPGDDEDDSDDDDDDLGPALPSAAVLEHNTVSAVDVKAGPEQTPATQLRRDDWMTIAPDQDDLAARMDPTRIRARGFNTGKSAKVGGHEAGSSFAWNETAEQKQKRLADEVLGIATQPKTSSKSQPSQTKTQRDEQTARRVRENEEKSRGPSLLQKHNLDKSDVDDDPSKRAFDREKDMNNASRITGNQKREMISKASDYSSRFSRGSYL